MITGVILLTSLESEEMSRLCDSLNSDDISVLEYTQDDVNEGLGIIREFVVDEGLETVLVANFLRDLSSEIVQGVREQAGLGRNTVSYIDVSSLFGDQQPEIGLSSASMTVLVSAARLRHANYAKLAVSRTLQGKSKVSRRELFRAIPRFLRVESEIPVVLDKVCAGRAKSCDYCREACPVNALGENGETISIDERVCIECGACARECPIGAIQSPSISDDQLLAMIRTLIAQDFETRERALILTCPVGFERLVSEARQGRHLEAGIVPVQIPCVACIGSIHYFWAASSGVRLATICPDRSCPKVAAVFPLNQHAQSSRDLSKNLGENRTLAAYHVILGADDSLIDSMSRIMKQSPHLDTGTVLSGVSRREATLTALRTLLAEADGGIELSTGEIPLFDLRVDSAVCTFCLSCERDCPDHAITHLKGEDSIRLMFDLALCSGCKACEKSCPEKAITVSRLTHVSRVLERKEAEKARDGNATCANCGVVLGSKRSLATLRKRLSDQGATEATLEMLKLCTQCKQKALLRPLAQ
jgi:ferredoxin